MKCPACGETMTVTLGDDDPATVDTVDTETLTCEACGRSETRALGPVMPLDRFRAWLAKIIRRGD